MKLHSIAVVLIAVLSACGERAVDTFCPPGTEHRRPRKGSPYEFCTLPNHGGFEGPYRKWGNRALPPVSEGTYWLNKKHGKWIDRYDDGTLMQVGEYLQDRRVGEWTKYDHRGRMSSRYTLDKEGRGHGIRLMWLDGMFIEAECEDHGQFVWHLNGTGPKAVDQATAEARPCP
jgi:hypothetical protein